MSFLNLFANFLYAENYLSIYKDRQSYYAQFIETPCLPLYMKLIRQRQADREVALTDIPVMLCDISLNSSIKEVKTLLGTPKLKKDYHVKGVPVTVLVYMTHSQGNNGVLQFHFIQDRFVYGIMSVLDISDAAHSTLSGYFKKKYLATGNTQVQVIDKHNNSVIYKNRIYPSLIYTGGSIVNLRTLLENAEKAMEIVVPQKNRFTFF